MEACSGREHLGVAAMDHQQVAKEVELFTSRQIDYRYIHF